MPLADPRVYLPENPSNPLILALQSILDAQNPQAEAISRKALHALMQTLIENQDHAAINAALSQAPSALAWRILSHSLQFVLETPPSGQNSFPIFFAIPLIVIAGSSQACEISCQVEAQKILDLLREKGLLGSTPAQIAPRLYDQASLAAISPSQWQAWQSGLTRHDIEHGELPFPVTDTPIHIKEESAWLRFLLGVVHQDLSAPSAISLSKQPASWAMPLSQKLGEMLGNLHTPLLIIPRGAQGPLAAQETGRIALLETRLQMLASNALRIIRSKRRTPAVTIASYEGEEIRVSIASLEDHERWYGFVWPLALGDDIAQIEQFITELFYDCQVEKIQVIEELQPDLQDGLPYFVTVHTPMQGAHP